MARGLWRLLLLAGALVAPTSAVAQPISEQMGVIPMGASTNEESTRINYESYILGPGDTLVIEIQDLPELSGTFTIGPDGTIYLPRIRAFQVEGLTVEEVRVLLKQKFSAFVLQPIVYVKPIRYRPIRIYVRGEVRRPGYYTLSGSQQTSEDLQATSNLITNNLNTSINLPKKESAPIRAAQQSINTEIASSAIQFPTVFDAIRAAQGITPYSDLGNVEVTRKQPISDGGGRIRAKLNFISLLTDGNESQNIRLLDGDVINVSKSDEVLREQLLEAGQTNLSPQFLEVFVSGRVRVPGGKVLPQSSTLVQAVDMAGGLKILHGQIEFIRFNREGSVDRRIFRFDRSAPYDSYSNPVLMAGDVIRARESLLSAATEVIGEVTEPVLGVYSVYSLLGNFGLIE